MDSTTEPEPAPEAPVEPEHEHHEHRYHDPTVAEARDTGLLGGMEHRPTLGSQS